MAFGLATFLLSQHWAWGRAQRTLLAFSAAAPVATLVTVWALGAVPLLTAPTGVALAVIFSGGTFTYAACMHILPGVLAGGAHGGGLAPAQLVAVAVGCLLPVALAVGHVH